ncbi:hypothetical protein BTO15_18000 [Polaribacter sejongensis]|uniref:Rad50/SbcC-type AAA domain-containing protein n=1 Tax=Polaribacter sejongensis TaxID=985043 RepID=A0ABM6Q3P1_9FLAO|nr:AAA family ATPase [Polaribacter sejongensis]AUC23871.1 hypothetical protein BTO15_18000 [Polaribacter sejongensis]
MALKIKIPKLIVNQLTLVGHRKNYDVFFKKGLNIVYGDSDTGKSSVLSLIDYLLGASKVPLYDEIEIAGKYCLLELELSGELFTIKRDLFESNKDIEVYRSNIENLEDSFPKFYSPNYKREGIDGYFSEFLLANMNIPITKIKQSPSKEDSKMSSLSFRDINKFIYLDQDQVGTKRIFGDNYFRISKLKEGFKHMHNVLDSQISELDNAISEKVNERKELNKKNLSVSSFLNETKVYSLDQLNRKKEEKEDEVFSINQKIKSIDEDIISNSQGMNSLREDVNSYENKLKYLYEEKSTKQEELKQNVSLRNEYNNDIKKMIATVEVLEKLPNLIDRKTECPVCEQEMNLSSLKKGLVETDPKIIKSELNGIKRRKKDLDKIYSQLIDKIDSNKVLIDNHKIELDELRLQFDRQTKDIVTPYISQRDSLTNRAGEIRSDIKNLKYFYKIRNQQSTIESEIVTLDKIITNFSEDLKFLKDSAPTLDRVFIKLRDSLIGFLNFIGMKNVHGVTISDKSYLPMIRNKNYEEITSGGVRTLTSIGYFISLLEYAIHNSVNYPSFLMIDTIAKYIGKTKSEYDLGTNLNDDLIEGMNDSTKYENIYRYLLNLNNQNPENFQMIIVDNDIPTNLESKLKPFIVKHFSTNPIDEDTEIGFINDANNFTGFDSQEELEL